MPNAWASILWYNMLTNHPKVRQHPLVEGDRNPCEGCIFFLGAVTTPCCLCAECELLHQAPGGDVGPGGWGSKLAVLLHHQEGLDHWTAHHTGWETARWAALKSPDTLLSAISPVLTCDILLCRALRQLLGLSDHLGQVLQGTCTPHLPIRSAGLPSYCFNSCPPSLFRKTWLAKASLSGCGWTTSSTWWRNTSWHCGMKGERSPLAYCQLCLTGVLASTQLAASWVVNSSETGLLFSNPASIHVTSRCRSQVYHGLHQQREGEGAS